MFHSYIFLFTLSNLTSTCIHIYQVSLTKRAEQALEETIRENTKGDVIYFWAHLEVDSGLAGRNNALTFWSMCDILNGGNCR